MDGGEQRTWAGLLYLGQVSYLLRVLLEPPDKFDRSVHNTRIERMWYDITHGFGMKWKNFFLDLEVNHGLNPQSSDDRWLLHHLFLHCIQEDADEWTQAWNSHKLQIRGERERSPRDMFLFSMIQDGPRGIVPLPESLEEDIEDPSMYGIDWEDADDPTLMNHLLTENPQDWVEENPFIASTGPPTFSHVPCESPNCPLSPDQVNTFDTTLATRVNIHSRSMEIRRLVWLEAANICRYLLSHVEQLLLPTA